MKCVNIHFSWIKSKVMNQVSSLSLVLVITSHLVLMKRIRYVVPALSATQSLFNDCKEEKSGKSSFLLLLVGFWTDILIAKSDVFLCIWEIMQNEFHCLVWLHRYVQQLTFKWTFGLLFYLNWDILLSSESVLVPFHTLKTQSLQSLQFPMKELLRPLQTRAWSSCILVVLITGN